MHWRLSHSHSVTVRGEVGIRQEEWYEPSPRNNCEEPPQYRYQALLPKGIATRGYGPLAEFAGPVTNSAWLTVLYRAEWVQANRLSRSLKFFSPVSSCILAGIVVPVNFVLLQIDGIGS